MKAIISWALTHRSLVCVLALLLAMAGGWAASTMPLDAVPDLSDVQVIVHTEWHGRDPQTVEDHVTYPVASRLLTVPRVRDVRGFSFFGFSFVYVVFEDGTDPYWARSRVLEHLSKVQNDLPQGASASLGPDATGLGWIYIYTLEDTQGELDLGELRALQDFFVRYQLAAVPGVAEVASLGGAVREYQITVDPLALAARNIPLSKVVMNLRRSNADVGGRVLEMSETEYMVRGQGTIRSIEDIEEVVLGVNEKGTPILLRDVAMVEIGPAMKRGIADKNGTGEVVAGIVTMRYGENALDVIRNVKERIADIEVGLPEGVVIKPAYDRSGLILRSIGTLKRQLWEELAIVALVCVIFLWHARSALVSAVVLPLSILASFLVMRSVGIGANIMSLGGIAIAIGTMVDSAVVMVENLHKHKERNPDEKDHWKLVRLASHEVGPALFFSLLVITVSFLPVFALEDQAGRLFKPLAFTKTFAMASAAVLSLVLLPVLMGFFIRGKIHAESSNPLSVLTIRAYLPVLRFALAHRSLAIGIALAILALTILPYRALGSEFMPSLREGDILAMPTTLPGISSTEARRTLQIQDRLLAQFPEVDVVLGKIGRADTPLDPAPLSMVETHITLHPEQEWPERIIEEDYVASVAKDMFRHARSKGFVLEEAEDELETAELVSQVTKMVHAALTRNIREQLVGGIELDELRARLPQLLAHHAAFDTQNYLDSMGALAETETPLADALADAWRDRIDGDEVPMRRTTFDELTKKEMQHDITIAGMPNWWLMPIETRIGMLNTGMRGVLGIKLYGSDLADLSHLATDIEGTLRGLPGTGSVVAERALGGHYLDIDVDRRECARYGLLVGDVQDVIEAAIGGKPVTTILDGRARFAATVRYPRELRDDPIKLGRTLVSTPAGAQIPLSQLATIRISEGPPVIKSENGLLLTNVPIDLESGVDIGSYVERAQAVLDAAIADGTLVIPPGCSLAWSGQYQEMEAVNKKLRAIVPLTLAIIILLIYLNTKSFLQTLITMITLPFALVGGVWLLFLLDYDVSVASGIGFIALAGLAAETAIIMHVYLDLALEKRRESGLTLSLDDVRDAVIEGAVWRVRPKLMTVATTILGLLPILWATGAGSGPMKRMAAPMIGGLISSMAYTLILIPVCYAIVREIQVRRPRGPIDPLSS